MSEDIDLKSLEEDDLEASGEVDGMSYMLSACKDVIVRREDWIGLVNDRRVAHKLKERCDDYEEVLADKCRLARELDIAMHGEEGAAEQASFCDLIEPARKLKERVEELETQLRTIEKDISTGHFGEFVPVTEPLNRGEY